MTFVHRATGAAESVAVFAGAFNPPTAAHVALAEAALDVVDEVLLVIPRAFPHKEYHGATLEQRLAMLQRIAASGRRLSAAVAEGGLFADIAREARSHYGKAQMQLLCGRDAAERILTWDYGDDQFVRRMLEQFELLVAPRFGEYVPEARFAARVKTLCTAGNYDECSSTRLREALRQGGDWRSLVPESIADMVEEIYRQ
ncbi:MAG TPA: adenylyltransferase/cytidyltransferase family protein [Bryobacteraceae bacterium]|nr:adenylyltransferase/cytidyltransferase family protein [Bryobacteraceae bacterium]